MEREKLSSRLGFIMLSAGCAIGCGNVWKFPWMTGQNGGGAFVLIYIICLLLLGLPAMTMEFALGRASQASPVKMYVKLEKPGQKWHIHGWFAFFANICLMAFYTVVAGWLMYYFVCFVTGRQHGLSFAGMISDAKVNVIYLAIVILITFVILANNISKGLERVTKYMMVALLVLMIVMAVKSITLSGAGEGLKFYLVPDFTKVNANVVVSAMNQAFFTLSIGIGSMAIFGSYISKERSLMGESLTVIILDTAVAIIAGLIIFPTCSTYGLEVGAGPALLFDTMATAFANMTGGRVWGSLFFLFMVFASMSTVLAVCENIVACFRELTGWKRGKSSAVCGIGLFIVALTTALGYSVIQFHPFGEGTAFLDLWDFIVSTNALPLGALVITLFCVIGRYGWGWDNFVAEANCGKGLKVQKWMRPIFTFVVPICIVVIYIIGLVNFNWG